MKLLLFALVGLSLGQYAYNSTGQPYPNPNITGGYVNIVTYVNQIDFQFACSTIMTETITIECPVCSATQNSTIVLMIGRSAVVSYFRSIQPLSVVGDPSGTLNVTGVPILTAISGFPGITYNYTFLWGQNSGQTQRTVQIVSVVSAMVKSSRVTLQDMSVLQFSVFGELLKNVKQVQAKWSVPFVNGQNGVTLGTWAANRVLANGQIVTCSDCTMPLMPAVGNNRTNYTVSWNNAGFFTGPGSQGTIGLQLGWQVSPEPAAWLCEELVTIIGAGVTGSTAAVIGTGATVIALFLIALIYTSFVWSSWFAKRVKYAIDTGKDVLDKGTKVGKKVAKTASDTIKG